MERHNYIYIYMYRRNNWSIYIYICCLQIGILEYWSWFLSLFQQVEEVNIWFEERLRSSKVLIYVGINAFISSIISIHFFKKNLGLLLKVWQSFLLCGWMACKIVFKTLFFIFYFLFFIFYDSLCVIFTHVLTTSSSVSLIYRKKHVVITLLS